MVRQRRPAAAPPGLDSADAELKQRINDLSQYVRDLKEEFIGLVHREIERSINTNLVEIGGNMTTMDKRLTHIETLLLHSDFETFEAIDRATAQLRSSQAVESQEKEMLLSPCEVHKDSAIQPEAETSPVIARVLEYDLGCPSNGVVGKTCCNEDICLCGFWASTKRCIVRVAKDSCYFLHAVGGDSDEHEDCNDDNTSTDGDAQLLKYIDGKFVFNSWETTSVIVDKIDWKLASSGGSLSWHRLSHRHEGDFTNIRCPLHVDDVVQVVSPFFTADSLRIELPANIGGIVKEVDDDGDYCIDFPALHEVVLQSKQNNLKRLDVTPPGDDTQSD